MASENGGKLLGWRPTREQLSRLEVARKQVAIETDKIGLGVTNQELFELLIDEALDARGITPKE